jgi:hypothetical protein
MSELRAGLETGVADADLPKEWGRLEPVGKQPTCAPIGSAGVVETARSEGIPGNVGDPRRARVATSNAAFRRRHGAGVGRVHSTVEAG